MEVDDEFQAARREPHRAITLAAFHERSIPSPAPASENRRENLTVHQARGTVTRSEHRANSGHRRFGFAMSVSYFKRYRMELDLRSRRAAPLIAPRGYRLLPWHPELLADHAEVKYHSFRNEIDSDVFACLGELGGCQRLMQEISLKDGFLPGATWLAVATNGNVQEPCGTIQGIQTSTTYGAIQNVGITPTHRGRGLGTALICAALAGFQQEGLARVFLEVTAQNDGAVRLYKRLGFRRTKTLFKAVELAYS
jgi:ribosomal protein S18 acetylase RimI-like enzyme